MIFFMSVCIQTFETVPIIKTFLTEKEIVTIFAHPAILYDFYFTIKAFMYFLVILLRLKNGFHLVVLLMSFRWILQSRSLEVTFLA